MKRNYKDIETILILTGSYCLNEKVLLKKTATGIDVNGFEFKSVKAACDFIESFYEVSTFSKITSTGARIAKASSREGAKILGFSLRWVGSSLQTIGVGIQKKGGL